MPAAGAGIGTGLGAAKTCGCVSNNNFLTSASTVGSYVLPHQFFCTNFGSRFSMNSFAMLSLGVFLLTFAIV
jgi:hypothetical protein